MFEDVRQWVAGFCGHVWWHTFSAKFTHSFHNTAAHCMWQKLLDSYYCGIYFWLLNGVETKVMHWHFKAAAEEKKWKQKIGINACCQQLYAMCKWLLNAGQRATKKPNMATTAASKRGLNITTEIVINLFSLKPKTLKKDHPQSSCNTKTHTHMHLHKHTLAFVLSKHFHIWVFFFSIEKRFSFSMLVFILAWFFLLVFLNLLFQRITYLESCKVRIMAALFICLHQDFGDII